MGTSREKFGAVREKLWPEFMTCDRETCARIHRDKGDQSQDTLKHRGKQRNFGSRFLTGEGILRAVQERGCTGAAEQGTRAASQAGVGLLDLLHAQLLGGQGADSEVFPGHQATRGSPGGCNSSSASILLSGPVPRACYCRCRAEFPTPGLSLSFALYPLPSTHQPLYKKQFGMPWGCPHPARAPASYPLHPSSLPSWFLSPHPGFVFITPSPSCKTASTDRSPHRVHRQKLGWLWPSRITTSIVISSHWDPRGRWHYPHPSHLPFPLLSTTSPGADRLLQRPPSTLPSPSASPGSLGCI